MAALPYVKPPELPARDHDVLGGKYHRLKSEEGSGRETDRQTQTDRQTDTDTDRQTDTDTDRDKREREREREQKGQLPFDHLIHVTPDSELICLLAAFNHFAWLCLVRT